MTTAIKFESFQVLEVLQIMGFKYYFSIIFQKKSNWIYEFKNGLNIVTKNYENTKTA